MTLPLPEQLTPLIERIVPDGQVTSVTALSLGFTNRSWRVAVRTPDGITSDFVIKRYAVREHLAEASADVVRRAALEHRLLDFVNGHGIPCPQVVLFDPNEPGLEAPILVTRIIPGTHILAHPPNPRWAAKATTIAEALASIHKLQLPSDLVAQLPDAMQIGTWFLEGNTIPDYMQAYPDGQRVWQTVQRYRPQVQATQRVLVHGDYWSGNMLWENGQLTGILDWERAAFGDPGFDIAYCRLEMFIEAMDEAADLFLKTYETLTGWSVVNLRFCELAIAALPMLWRPSWLTQSPIQERYRRFVATAFNEIQQA